MAWVCMTTLCLALPGNLQAEQYAFFQEASISCSHMQPGPQFELSCQLKCACVVCRRP